MDKNLITQALKNLKCKHNVTTKEWAALSGVPESTIARYLSCSLNIPNFPYVCALIKCFPGESIDDFFEAIDRKIDAPSDALKLDAVPPAIVGDIVIDSPEMKATLQERILIQTEAIVELKGILHEKEAAIDLLEAKLEMVERIVEEKERSISSLEDTNKRRLSALMALCSAQ